MPLLSPVLEIGTAESTALAAWLLEARKLLPTGVLAFDHGPGEWSKLFLKNGLVVGAQSSKAFKPLGQQLWSAGVITTDAYEHSLTQMARTGRLQGEILVEQGVISQEVLEKSLRNQHYAYVKDIAAIGRGAYRFDAAATLPKWTDTLALGPARCLIEALSAPAAEALVATTLAPIDGMAVIIHPSYSAVARDFDWPSDQHDLARHLTAPRLISTLCDATGLLAARVRAAVAALLLWGVAQPRPVSQAKPIEAPAPPAKQAATYRAIGLMADGFASKDYFARLGVKRLSTSAQVKDAYAALIARYHPAQFKYAPPDVQKHVAVILAAVHEAHAVLSIDRTRARYLVELETHRSSNTSGAIAAFQGGETALQVKDYRTARESYERAVSLDPKPEYLAALAWSLVVDSSAADAARARALLAKALQDENCERALFVSGVIDRLEGLEDAALRNLTALIRLNPRHEEAKREIRIIHMRRETSKTMGEIAMGGVTRRPTRGTS